VGSLSGSLAVSHDGIEVTSASGEQAQRFGSDAPTSSNHAGSQTQSGLAAYEAGP
jgi:hypothetical protein